MKRCVVILVLGILAFAMQADATIINIPDDYPTIQQGIDASSDGDTVLVQPGTYVENVNFNGHNVVLGSLFLTTGDTTYIAETIIDGDLLGSVVTFESGEDSTAIIVGFTIQNGYAENGGGIFSVNSDPSILNNIIKDNATYGDSRETNLGGGIYCLYSNPVIAFNNIRHNMACYGGGIYFDDSNPTIVSNSIFENSAIP